MTRMRSVGLIVIMLLVAYAVTYALLLVNGRYVYAQKVIAVDAVAVRLSVEIWAPYGMQLEYDQSSGHVSGNALYVFYYPLYVLDVALWHKTIDDGMPPANQLQIRP